MIIGNTDAFCTKFLIFLTILFSRDVQQRRFVIEQRRAMRGRAIRIQVTRMRLSPKNVVYLKFAASSSRLKGPAIIQSKF